MSVDGGDDPLVGHCIVYHISAGVILDGNNPNGSIRITDDDLRRFRESEAEVNKMFNENGYKELRSVHLSLVKKSKLGEIQHYV